MIVLYVILGIIAAFLAVVLIRTAQFTVKPVNKEKPADVDFDREKSLATLQALIQCKTVSSYTPETEDNAEFDKLYALLPQLYPHVFATCTLTKFPDRGLLFRWGGKGHGNPAVLMAHYDVVPVNEDAWEKPPFAGILENGVLWGRGALDTKVTFNGILSGAEHLIAQGYVPDNDIYFAFSGGEEVNGAGAVHIVDWFEKNGITPELVVDEGGAVVEDIFPGVTGPCALIGIAEKGMMNLEYKALSNGGHASAPRPHTPLVELADACTKVENHPAKFHITKPVAEMFDTLGRHSSFVYRMIFANLWCFSPVLDMICKKSGGELNALCRTTVAFTQTSGSSAPNVIPPQATLVSNIRLNPADSVASETAYIKKVIDNDKIELTVAHSMEPSPISRTDVPGYARVVNAVEGTWQGALVAPYLMVQCSDSRHYGRISDRVYRFSAMDLTAEERGTIHGNNERIRVEAAGRATEFFIRLMLQC